MDRPALHLTRWRAGSALIRCQVDLGLLVVITSGHSGKERGERARLFPAAQLLAHHRSRRDDHIMHIMAYPLYGYAVSLQPTSETRACLISNATLSADRALYAVNRQGWELLYPIPKAPRKTRSCPIPCRTPATFGDFSLNVEEPSSSTCCPCPIQPWVNRSSG